MKQTPVTHAIVSDLYWIPVDEVDAGAVRERFTIHKRIPVYGTKRVEVQSIPTYREDAILRPGLIGVPIAAGEQLFPATDTTEDLTDGSVFDQWTRLPDPNHPNAAPGQAAFMRNARTAVDDLYTTLIKADTGCHAPGTLVRMYSGATKAVECVRVGDRLMGPDNRPRTVLRTVSGRQTMYRITPHRGGEPFVVNADHKLCLTRTRVFHGDKGKSREKQRAGEKVVLTVREYLSKSDRFKHLHKLWRTGCNFHDDGRPLSVDPYIFGLWLGDGTSRSASLTTMDEPIADAWIAYAEKHGDTIRVARMSGNKASTYHMTGNGAKGSYLNASLGYLGVLGPGRKRVPLSYLRATRDERLSLLAGIIDTDGHLSGSVYEIVQKNEKLLRDIVSVSRSLGFGVTVSRKTVNGVDYHRAFISGDTDLIPVRLPRKKAQPRRQKKNPLVSGFSVENIGVGDYYGFALSGDHLYLTDDYTVHHNTGKTVVALWLAAQLGRSTLVLVPKIELMRQWIQQAQDVLGLERKHIGVIQGNKCQYQKPLVIGVMKSNAMRRYPPEMYRAFGTVIYDELHNLGAVLAAKTQGLFTARNKIGQTATDMRKDGADEVYFDYFGKPAFDVKMDALPTKVLGLPLSTPPVRGRGRTERNKALAANHERNETLARIVVKWYEAGHEILGVSDFVDHCELFREYLIALGVPRRDIGMYVAEQTDGHGVKRAKTLPEYLDWCKSTPPIFLATYGMMTEGTDVPRLDRGIDLTPRSDMPQLLGRIRRRYPGKESALWVTPRDRLTKQAEGAFHSRVRSIRQLDNVTVGKTSVAELLG